MDILRIRGKNLIAAGWYQGIFEALFSNGGRYRYTGVPEDALMKLVRSPYPDSLFHKLIATKGYKAEKVG